MNKRELYTRLFVSLHEIKNIRSKPNTPNRENAKRSTSKSYNPEENPENPRGGRSIPNTPEENREIARNIMNKLRSEPDKPTENPKTPNRENPKNIINKPNNPEENPENVNNIRNIINKIRSKTSISDIGHTALDIAGLVPVIGEPADLVNSAWYAAEGDPTNAALSAASAIPVLGAGPTAVRLIRRAAGAIPNPSSFRSIPKTPAAVPTTPNIPTKSSNVPGSAPTKGFVKRFANSPTTKGALASAGTTVALNTLLQNSSPTGNGNDVATGTSVVDPFGGDNIMNQQQISKIGSNTYQLGTFDAATPSLYTKSILSSNDNRRDVPGYNPFFTMDNNVALQFRRRNSALPESVNPSPDNHYYKRAYSAVNRYLRSSEGKNLSDHLSKIKINID